MCHCFAAVHVMAACHVFLRHAADVLLQFRWLHVRIVFTYLWPGHARQAHEHVLLLRGGEGVVEVL